jgi:NADH dehydrogenase (ubiquinone) 1 alpha subcomplex subunit 13
MMISGTETQELPLKEGFPTINYKRKFPSSGPPGWVLLTMGAAMMTIGFYLHFRGRKYHKFLLVKNYENKAVAATILAAENDIEHVKNKLKSLELESKLMKDVPGWQVGKSVYNNENNYIPDGFFLSTSSSK